MKIKSLYKLGVATIAALSFGSCSDFLEETPNAILSDSNLSGAKQADAMVISAYSMLGNDHYTTPLSLWPYGSVRSDDAYKGGRDEADIQAFHFYETSTFITPNLGEPDGLWFLLYEAIGRCNTAINLLKNVPASELPARDERIAECRFLRGHFYFMLKKLFKYVPYITDETDTNKYGEVSNREYSNDELWSKIIEDFKAAEEVLPATQAEKGRPTKAAAAAYVAKLYTYKAYRQDEAHNVTEISREDMQAVLDYTDKVLAATYDLESDFANNFLAGEYENGVESVWAIQFSQDDGTKFGRLNFSDVLNVPMGFSGSCDFHKPSQNLVNAFKTTDGLPQFGTFNNADYNSTNDKVDPRLYHTVAMNGLPYKYDQSTIYNEGWTRTPSVYGYYSSLKENLPVGDPASVLLDPFRANSMNRIVIRYADVLLMRAEALIALDRKDEALPLINQVRTRAAQSTARIGYATNCDITTYQPGVNCTWTKEYAMKALKFERRLEFAMESQRFFDLVRWGEAAEVLNEYYEQESEKIAYYKSAQFTKNQAEYLPIPQPQINFSRGVYQQNNNY